MSPGSHRVALALGSGITLLGVLRALAKANVTAFGLPDADKLARRSRHFKAGPSSLAGVDATTLGEALRSLPKRTVIFGCSDYWARAVAALPPEVLADYPASIAPLEALDLLVDKARLRETLERLGIPHPRTRDVLSPADLEGLP